jgi:hypothetical protein
VANIIYEQTQCTAFAVEITDATGTNHNQHNHTPYLQAVRQYVWTCLCMHVRELPLCASAFVRSRAGV